MVIASIITSDGVSLPFEQRPNGTVRVVTSEVSEQYEAWSWPYPGLVGEELAEMIVLGLSCDQGIKVTVELK